MGKPNSKDYIYEGAILCGVGILLMLILFGAFGSSGKVVSNAFVGIFGYASYAGAVLTFIMGIIRFLKFKPHVTKLKLAGLILMVITLILIAQVATSNELMGTYGGYLSNCYHKANTAGGALFGVIAFPLMAINYYFAIVLSVLLFLAATVMAFFVEINAKAVFRSIVKGKKGRQDDADVDIVRNAEEDAEAKEMLNDEIRIKRVEEDYVPLDRMDMSQGSMSNYTAKSEFVAPTPMQSTEDSETVRTLNERERAEQLLYGDVHSRRDNDFNAEPIAEQKPSAVELLYSNKTDMRKKEEFSEADREFYTNSSRKRIIEENRAKKRAAENTLYGDVSEASPFISNSDNNYTNSAAGGYRDTASENNRARTDNSQYAMREQSERVEAVQASRQPEPYHQLAMNRVETVQAVTPSLDSEEAADKGSYREYLERKRQERSDKGGVHNTPIAPIKTDVPTRTEKAEETGSRAVDIGTVATQGGFVGKVTNSASKDYSRHALEEDKPKPVVEEKPIMRPYKAPPIALLRSYVATPPENEDLRDKIDILENTLASFNIQAKVVNVITGPAFSRLELQMPAGISVSKINAYTNDIAMCLEAKSVRCQIPIPGKNLFGVEIPNKSRGTVGFKSLLGTPEFNANKHALSFAVGRDCDGKTYVVDLNKMPHLLIAGSTGSGKSVCINTLICSLLYKYSPEEVKIALVDPKQVELSSFNDLPHLLVSKAICDNKKVINLLDYAIEEMENRYTIMSESRVKNIAQYNETVDTSKREKLPYLVIVVDEVADIVLNLKREFEDRIMRLAQKARAAGIILVLATQRPSVDVITGSIKANLPSRIAFMVTSFVDSKTIIDQGGAEKLLGLGDMLFSESTSPDVVRLQGAFIDANEVNAVCDYIRDNNDAWFDPIIEERITKVASDDEDFDAMGNGVRDPEIDILFIKSLQSVVETRIASASRLQRVIGLGFPKAAKYIDMMEAMGFIGKPTNGNKGREVILTMEKFLEIYGDVELY